MLHHRAFGAEKDDGNLDFAIASHCDEFTVAQVLLNLGNRYPQARGHLFEGEQRLVGVEGVGNVWNGAHNE
jgi:hypothetical protein